MKNNPRNLIKKPLTTSLAPSQQWTGALRLGLSLKAYACSLPQGGVCLVILAPKELFQTPERLKQIYPSLLSLYPGYRLLFLSEEQAAKSYFGHPEAEQELFALLDQVRHLQQAPPTYCLLPQTAYGL